MFFSGRAKSRVRQQEEDLVARLAADRSQRHQAKLLERTVLLVQSMRRAKLALRASRASVRADFDARIGAALANRRQQESESLARCFAFFSVPTDEADLKRLLLLSALFRDCPAPLCLVTPALAVLATQPAQPLALVGAVLRLVSTSLGAAQGSERHMGRLLGAAIFFQHVSSCLRTYGATPALRGALLGIALLPFRLMRDDVVVRPFRREFTCRILTIAQVLASQPVAQLAGVVVAIEPPATGAMAVHDVLSIVGNLAFLVANNVLAVAVIETLGSLLPLVAKLIFPGLSDDVVDDVDSDDEPAATTSPALSELSATVLGQLSVLVADRTVRQLFAQHVASRANMAGLCVVYAALLELWPAHKDTIRSAVAFGAPEALPALWDLVWGDDASVRAFQQGSAVVSNSWPGVLRVFCEVYGRLLAVQTDEDVQQGPLSIEARVNIVRLLRPVVARMYLEGNTVVSAQQRKRFAVTMLKQLYDRDCRVAFVPPGEWQAPELQVGMILRELGQFRLSKSMEWLLAECPFFFSFMDRVQVLRLLFRNDGGPDEFAHVMGGVRVQIRRNEIVRDGLTVFKQLREDNRLKERLRITFINQEGLEEAGVDGGGVYKEFLNQLVAAAFRDQRLFWQTDSYKLYPNPYCRDLEMYEYLGMVLGKALFENQLVELPLAPFFLSKLLGKTNSFADLQSLDAELYRNLVFVLKCRNVAELGLTWSVSERDPTTGAVAERDLVPGGGTIPVTQENRVHYVYALANARLNVDLRLQSKAFVRGLSRLVKGFALQMFSAKELQTLISGEDGPLDVDAWQRAVHYAGGFHPSQPIIHDFWETVRGFTPVQQRKLLRFVTSSSFVPLMGWEALNPPITISKRDGGDEYLPTAATCVNLLKLPEYSNKWIMRERLLYAIESNEGFELS